MRLLRSVSLCFAVVLGVQACGARIDGGGGRTGGGAGGIPSTGGSGGADDVFDTGGGGGGHDAGARAGTGTEPLATAGAAGNEGQALPVCGDGALDAGEACDDGTVVGGDGCSATCQLEVGFACEGEPSVCSRPNCGNGVREGLETCDDGNRIPFDGCGGNCQAEPTCDSGDCQSACGDGILIGEECDDGNTQSGDGCSPTCKVEPGFVCAQAHDCERIAGQCVLRLPVIYRDLTDEHPDFEPTCIGPNGGLSASPGLVNSGLKAGVPVASATAANAGCITKLEDWYSDSGSKAIVRELVLFDHGNGAYVNRYGQLGEQWASQPMYKNARFCGIGDTHCLASPPLFPGCQFDASVETCLYPCPPSIGVQSDSCAAVLTPATKYDGSPLFFPLDDQPKSEPWFDAKVPNQFGYYWEYEDQVLPVYGATHVAGKVTHNFHFTTQAASWFKYDASATIALDFTGDDDLWVFVNGRLAVDLGGVHPPVSGSVTLNSITASNFALDDGKVYRIDIFHADRKKDSSSLRISLPSFDLSRSVCARP